MDIDCNKGEMKMNRKKEKYYAVSGINGYGVYTDYEKVKDTIRFLANPHYKKYTSFECAKESAVSRFYDLQEYYHREFEIEELRKVNWTYYRKMNRTVNMDEL